MVLISVVIPTYNRKELLQKCIKSILNQSYKGFEIIVVDDGSNDGTESVVKRFRMIKYIKQYRKGSATARNIGIMSAKGRIIAFTDDDCEVDLHWLKNLVLTFKKNKECDAVKGNTKSITQDNNSLAYHLEKKLYISKSSSATNNIAYTMKSLESIKFFDENFPLPAYEDTDLLMRFKMEGYKIKYSEDAIVYHHYEKNLNEFKRKYFITGLGMSYFFKKYLLTKPSISFAVIFQTFLQLVYLPKFLLTRLTKKRYYFSIEYFRIIKCINEIKGLTVGLINPTFKHSRRQKGGR